MSGSDVRRAIAALIAVGSVLIGSVFAGELAPRVDSDEQAPVADDTGVVIRQYPLHHVEGNAVLAVLKSFYPAHAGPNAYARFAFDSRRKVILTIIGKEHHEKIAKIVAMLDKPLDAPPGGKPEPDRSE